MSATQAAQQATQMPPNFKVGDKAVYPGQGVGEVMGIEHKEVAGQRQSFYVLRILENGMKIMIPMNKVGSVGLREIIGEKDVRKVYTILREKEVSVDSTTWNRRYREYMDKIKTGSVFEIAEVLRDLYLLRVRQGPVLRRAEDARHGPLPAHQGARDREGVRRGRRRAGSQDHLQLLTGRPGATAPGRAWWDRRTDARPGGGRVSGRGCACVEAWLSRAASIAGGCQRPRGGARRIRMIRGERVAAIVAAGGSGVRAGVRKQWLELGGETVLRRAARVLAASEAIDELVVVVPPGEEERGAGEAQGLGKPARAVAGGVARADSVRNGARAAEGCGIVLVHDAARPFATAALVARVAEAAARDGAALAALPVTDTVKRAAPPDGKAPPRVEATLDRRALWLAQTPQAFRRDLLLAAYDAAGDRAADATDECALVEAFGAPVTLVPGEPGNFKITGPDDVARARAALEAPVAMGVGYDTHRFAEGRARARRRRVRGRRPPRSLRRGRVRARHRRRDPGRGGPRRSRPALPGHRPPRWKGVSSLALLREIARKAADAGCRLGNCDVTLAARRRRRSLRAPRRCARASPRRSVRASRRR